MSSTGVTRGYGLMEKFLATKRSKIANKLILSPLRSGKILDFGCGAHPLSLEHTDFQEKYGVDLFPGGIPHVPGMTLSACNFEAENLPFPDSTFAVVTMLAVFEHITPTRLPIMLSEIKRVLKPGGQLIITTPTPLSVVPLWIMSHTGLVSSEEIHDHKGAYSIKDVVAYLAAAGFLKDHTRSGYFELCMNAWYVAQK